jgi:hypothetical protein
MGTFSRMFLIGLVITVGACSKQAPKRKVESVRVVVIYPCDYKSDTFDPQDYDLVEG